MSVGVRSAAGGDAVDIDVKVIPNARRPGVEGSHGGRLKVKVSAPAEGGQANRAVCAAVAGALGVAVRDVTVWTGHTRPEKVVRVVGLGEGDVVALLGRALG